MIGRETAVKEPRYYPTPPAKSLLPHTLLACVSIIAGSLIIANAIKPPCGGQHGSPIHAPPPESIEPPVAMSVPCDAQAGKMGGPFRPRPKPEPPVPAPDESAMDTRERRLFENVRKWVEGRDARLEARAEAKAEQMVQQSLEEVTANMEHVDVVAIMSGDTSKVVQGGFGAVFVAKLWAFVKKAVEYIVTAIILTILGGLCVKYWFVVGPVAMFLFIGLPAWSARTFSKKTS